MTEERLLPGFGYLAAERATLPRPPFRPDLAVAVGDVIMRSPLAAGGARRPP